jgi:ankyrin repeat protein
VGSGLLLRLSFLRASDHQGNTALHVAAARGNTDTLLLLLEYAAAPDAANDVGDSPLHLATWFGNHECVKQLLTYSASASLLNALGLDPYANVISRSPLAKKKKLPSDLRKALALLVHNSRPNLLSNLQTPPDAAPPPPAEPSTDPSTEGAEPAPPRPSPHEPLRASTGSLDDFHDCEGD